MLGRLWKREPGTGDKAAFTLPGGLRGVLCLHGFSGTPFEIKPLAEGLAGRGFTVHAPALAGHCGTLEDLARTRWPDWQRSVEQALDRLLAAVGGPVGVAGFSLGGLLALRLARLRPHDIAALVVMSAPLRLRSLQIQALRALARVPALLRRASLPKLGGYDMFDEEMKRKNPSLTALPLAGVVSMLELGDIIRADLPAIRIPTLVAHGHRDRTVPLDDSLELVGSLGSEVIERLWLPQSGHLIAIDVERTMLIDAAGRFLVTHLPETNSALR